MSRKLVSIEIGPAHEALLLQYAAFLDEMDHLAAVAPDGSAFDAREEAVIEKGREQQRRVLEHAVRARLGAAEKRGAAEGLHMRAASRESRRRHPRGLHPPRPDHDPAAMVGLAMRPHVRRLPRSAAARPTNGTCSGSERPEPQETADTPGRVRRRILASPTRPG